LLIRGGTVIDERGVRRADVRTSGEEIAEVGRALVPAAGEEVTDASGAYVIPGAIDVHTHLDLPVGEVRSADDFLSGTVAAACGGTTCVIDFAGAGREPWRVALETWHAKAAGLATVDYGLHLTVTELPEGSEDARARFEQFAAAGVTSVKLYMAYPDRLMVDDETIGRALASSPPTGVRVCVHAEDQAVIDRCGSRPPEAEVSAIRRAAALARAAGAELYIVHLSSAAGLEAIRAARAEGTRLLCETCPQYLLLDGSALSGPAGRDYVCSPPLRTAADRAALWTALGSGEVEIVSTDHCPFTRADRRRDPGHVPGGLPGVETRLALAYQGVRDGRLTLERWVDAVTGAPARHFGLRHRKGALRPGLDADLVIFDPAARRRLDAANLHSRSDHSPYQGLEVTGWPALTLSRGRVVARDGEPADVEPGWGRYVARHLSAAQPRHSAH